MSNSYSATFSEELCRNSQNKQEGKDLQNTLRTFNKCKTKSNPEDKKRAFQIIDSLLEAIQS